MGPPRLAASFVWSGMDAEYGGPLLKRVTCHHDLSPPHLAGFFVVTAKSTDRIMAKAVHTLTGTLTPDWPRLFDPHRAGVFRYLMFLIRAQAALPC
jgi:hypothetical protein